MKKKIRRKIKQWSALPQFQKFEWDANIFIFEFMSEFHGKKFIEDFISNMKEKEFKKTYGLSREQLNKYINNDGKYTIISRVPQIELPREP